ncbi:MAG: hypothetical protein PHQ04_01990 [Opitutaceae bacterium]|nr:hypothetical protein [Opitutaceae bacterium]
MPIWEYKAITSGPLGFATQQLLEQHLNQLGKEEWEIIFYQTKPDNPLAFHGLARRAITRDWFPKPEETKSTYVPPPIPCEAEEDDGRDERSFADELPPARPANVPAQTDMGLGDFDDLEVGSEEDLPTLFEALQPYLRKNARGDQSVGLDFLAKKFEQNEQELLGAFEECGLKAPTQAGAKGEVVDYEGGLYWLERDKRGRLWLNTREKKFKAVKTTPVPSEPQVEATPAPEAAPVLTPVARPDVAGSVECDARGPESFLGRLCRMMRRNRRGYGWSGSFNYLTKALAMDEAKLLAALGELGLRLPAGTEEKPVMVEDEGRLFWLNKNQRGEIWINARKGRQVAETVPVPVTPPPEVAPVEGAPSPSASLGNVLTAARLHLQPKKRGAGVAAQVGEVARALGRSEEELLQALVSAGLNVPVTPKDKPTFGEQGGEIFWLNRNAKDQLWLNAKESVKRKARARKSEAVRGKD